MLLDTDVMIDILRGHPPAIAWLSGLGNVPVGLPGLVAMELLQGCHNLSQQQNLDKQVRRFNLHWPSLADCQRAYQDFAAYRLSHNLGLLARSSAPQRWACVSHLPPSTSSTTASSPACRQFNPIDSGGGGLPHSGVSPCTSTAPTRHCRAGRSSVAWRITSWPRSASLPSRC